MLKTFGYQSYRRKIKSINLEANTILSIQCIVNFSTVYITVSATAVPQHQWVMLSSYALRILNLLYMKAFNLISHSQRFIDFGVSNRRKLFETEVAAFKNVVSEPKSQFFFSLFGFTSFLAWVPCWLVHMVNFLRILNTVKLKFIFSVTKEHQYQCYSTVFLHSLKGNPWIYREINSYFSLGKI